MPGDAIRIVSPMVMEVSASVLDEAESHVTWSVGYAPELDEDGGRFLLANLHAGSLAGRVDVEVSATQFGGRATASFDRDESDRFATELAGAEALETLYDFTRIIARGLLGTADIDLELPLASPTPEITQLVRSTDSETEAEPTEGADH
ncbi:hypothetical protein [Rathayibacter soli]|uniref:hypothetical protein n=1 Tax=Rathayibacter soli TaxID=3144168 RepID=UPI0027E570E4|nr:hypothetical protein [Glaciibacter superstes]